MFDAKIHILKFAPARIRTDPHRQFLNGFPVIPNIPILMVEPPMEKNAVLFLRRSIHW